MRDTKAFLKDGRVILKSFQGSTVYFRLEDLPFNPTNVMIKSEVRNSAGSKVGEFEITPTTTSVDFKLSHLVTQNLQATDGYISDNELIKKLNNITIGKYYFDVEITENDGVYKLFTGVLILLPEYTKGGTV